MAVIVFAIGRARFGGSQLVVALIARHDAPLPGGSNVCAYVVFLVARYAAALAARAIRFEGV